MALSASLLGALSQAVQQAGYPLPAYNFQVTVDGQSASFTEVSGLVIEYETLTYRHGLSNWEGETITRLRPIKHVPVTLKQGTVKGRNFFADWLGEEPPKGRPMAISLCDQAGQPVVVWRIGEAIATRLSAPAFDAHANAVSIETLDLMVSRISLEHV